MAEGKQTVDRRYSELDRAYDALIKALQAQRKETAGRASGLGRYPDEAIDGTVVVLAEAREVLKWLEVTEVDLMKREPGVTWAAIGKRWRRLPLSRGGAQDRWVKLKEKAHLELAALQDATRVLRDLNRRRDDRARRDHR